MGDNLMIEILGFKPYCFILVKKEHLLSEEVYGASTKFYEKQFKNDEKIAVR